MIAHVLDVNNENRFIMRNPNIRQNKNMKDLKKSIYLIWRKSEKHFNYRLYVLRLKKVTAE